MVVNRFAPKNLLKGFVWKTCGPSLQHRLRRFHAVRQIRQNRHFREPEMQLIKSLVSRGDRVADVGANLGVYTTELSLAAGPAGKVYSFEPVRENYDILSTVVRKMHLDNVLTFNLALGSSPAESYIVIPDMEDFRGFYWAHLASPGDQGRREKVKVGTFDELFSSGVIQRLEFIKCDVEGGELEVLLGGVEMIQSQTPGWLIEVSRQTSDRVFKLLQGLGYRSFVFNERLIETHSYRDKEFSNYFFFHPASMIWRQLSPYVGS